MRKKEDFQESKQVKRAKSEEKAQLNYSERAEVRDPRSKIDKDYADDDDNAFRTSFFTDIVMIYYSE